MNNKGLFESLTPKERGAVMVAIIQKLRQMRESREYDIKNKRGDYWEGPINLLESAESKLRRV